MACIRLDHKARRHVLPLQRREEFQRLGLRHALIPFAGDHQARCLELIHIFGGRQFLVERRVPRPPIRVPFGKPQFFGGAVRRGRSNRPISDADRRKRVVWPSNQCIIGRHTTGPWRPCGCCPLKAVWPVRRLRSSDRQRPGRPCHPKSRPRNPGLHPRARAVLVFSAFIRLHLRFVPGVLVCPVLTLY